VVGAALVAASNSKALGTEASVPNRTLHEDPVPVDDEIDARPEPLLEAPSTPGLRLPWRLQTRIAFRFCFVYFGLYVATTQMLSAMLPLLPPLAALPPIRPLVQWTARHVFHIAALVIFSGSGDKYFDWVQVFCLLCVSVIAVAGWCVAARRRAEHESLLQWFRVFMRFALGVTMIGYGFSKVFPLQMPYPQLTRLVEPFGNFSPMGVLWYSIGAAPAYETFVGALEVIGGVLLFVPRTAPPFVSQTPSRYSR
jgi:hypothetical protein